MRMTAVLVGLAAAVTALALPASACDLPVCTATRAQDIPMAVSDGAGGAIVVWRDNRNIATGLDLYAQHILANFAIDPAWPLNGVAITQAPDDQGEPDITSDGAGGAFIVWTDLRDFNLTRVDVYAQHVLANGAIAPGWPANGVALCTAVRDQEFPHIIADGSGGAFAVWEDGREGGGATLADVYGTRILADGTFAPGWGVNGNPICNAAGEQHFPVLVADGSGGEIVAWDDKRNFALTGDDVYAVRLTGAGGVAVGWPAQGVALSAAPGPQSGNMVVASDGAGGAIAAWEDYRNDPDYSDIYAQHVTAAGTIAAGWPADGVAVCTAANLQYTPAILADGAGGVFLVWDDYRDYALTASDLFGQHLQADGTIAPGWVANGLRVATGAGYQLFAKLVTDGAGGMMMSYESETSTTDLYAQRVAADGTFPPGWSVAGRALCTGPSIDDQGAPVANNVGGMIVASEHVTATVSDIYASLVRPDGPVATLVALTSAEADPDHVTLSWYGDDAAGMPASVERRTATADWARLADIVGDGSGTLRYVDEAVTSGTRYAYRLSYASGTETSFTAETWVDVPRPVFALHGLQPNPAIGSECMVSFSLSESAPATLEVFDVAGRRVVSRDVGGSGTGAQRIRLDQGAHLAPGVYTLRLTQAGRTLSARGVILR